MTKSVLVTGGAGYVGSHVVHELVVRGFDVTVLDNLQQGHPEAVPQDVPLIEADLRDAEAVRRVFQRHRFDAVMHFASNALVGESMEMPFLYLKDNLDAALNLVGEAVRHDVGKFVLSSTSNIFGNPERFPIDEECRDDPGSPYGESKLMIEKVLAWMDRVYGLRSACLRYFNAAGAHPDGILGEDHDPETHLIPIVLDTAAGRRPHVDVYGTDYPTPDGTCIRDFVHVCDLADAHLRALDRLDERSWRFNIGSGHGFSVRQVIETAERVTGRPIPVREVGRRPGDPAVLVACSDRLRAELGWEPRFSSLKCMLETAWAWRVAHPNGYGRRAKAPKVNVAPIRQAAMAIGRVHDQSA